MTNREKELDKEIERAMRQVDIINEFCERMFGTKKFLNETKMAGEILKDFQKPLMVDDVIKQGGFND